MNFARICWGIPFAVFIAGCSKAPDCSSENSITAIKKILSDEAAQVATQLNTQPDKLMAHISFDLSGIRTLSHDTETGRYTCAATISSSISDAEMKTLNGSRDAHEMFKQSMRGIAFEGTTMSGPIAYGVQLTDDKKTIYGEVDNGVAGFIQSRVMVANIADGMVNVPGPTTGSTSGNPPPANPSGKEITFTGKIEAEGTSFVGVNATDGTGYTVPNDSSLAKQLLAACQYGDMCTVVGAVSDDQFVSIKTVQKVTP